ncbi:SDR family mycofactocin-dependent oxidoreductase [Nocardioides aromaticivorans]|uniref:SDR family mycofactocin-dependent oxidoreductase n=1 Tax=Nocardioides aromaticivorans TaxID=200618 RepID=A0ABX7PSY0_9ACTN|nr:SDR family mycofactocin-dependent oxidoreductase [Nocardioides aromaticivorans]
MPVSGKLAARVVFITGAARGQGRSHAIGAAREGADVILTDVVAPLDGVDYELPTRDDLDQVVKEVEALGQRAIAFEADVRDLDALQAGLDAAVAELGRLDVVVANAGILGAMGKTWEVSKADWDRLIDVNLTGVWHTVKVAVPHMISAGNGGSVVLISSIAGKLGIPNVAAYVSAKHALVGLAGSLANEGAEFGIRANTVHPTNVDTPMINNPEAARLFRPDLEHPTFDDAAEPLGRINLLPVPWVQAQDITDAVLWLASDESKYVTGASIPVDAGMLSKYHG